MSAFSDNANEMLKSADDLAEGINKDTLRLRAVRIDRILNGEIMPYLAVHIALIGACIVIARFSSWPSLFILFSSIVAGLSVAYFVSRLRAQRQTGIPAACLAFATAAAACAPITAFQGGLSVALVYALVALLAIFRKIDPEEFLFAPLYSAIMINVSGMRAYEVPLYLSVFCLGLLALIQLGRMQISFGLFAGMLVVLCSEINKRTSGEGGLVVICILSVSALLIYVVRAVQVVNSDFRNFLSQGLVALTILAVIVIFTDDPRPYWLWPIGIGLFFAFMYAVWGHAAGTPTSIAWTCMQA